MNKAILRSKVRSARWRPSLRVQPDAAPDRDARGIRVVRVIARLNVGGPAIHVLNLSAGLEERYPTLLVHGSVDEGEVELGAGTASRALRMEVIPELGRRVRPWQDLVAFVKLVRLLRRVKPEVVHTHTAKAGTLGRLAAVCAGVPIRVHTYHGHVFHGYFGPLTSRLVVWVERLLSRLTTRVITISATQAEEIAGTYGVCGDSRVSVVPLGFDLARFSPAAVAALAPEFRAEIGAGDRPVVTTVGRLVPVKNHALFVEMAAAIRDEGLDCVYVVVGGGAEEGALRARVRDLRMEDSFRFLGWRDDVERIYGGSDVVVLTSNNEGTPVCLIEALAAGRAVVATDVGGVRDVVEGGRLGMLVAPRDLPALTAAVRHLLDRPDERLRLGALGARSIPARFGIRRLLSEIGGLYDSLIDQTVQKSGTDCRNPQ